MEYFAGLDVSLETVDVCIRWMPQVTSCSKRKIAAEPAAIVHLLEASARRSSA